MKYILVLGAQVPFISGGAELLNETLVSEINKLEGYQAELVQLPYKWYPEEQLIDDILAWRMLDLTESNGKKVDLIIATKFPSYVARHPKKVLWLVHQHRYFYDLQFSEYDDVTHCPDIQDVRDTVRQLDSKMIKECNPRYSIAQNVNDRLKKYNNIDSITLYPPAPLCDSIISGSYGDYIVYIGRVERIKRVKLLVEAAAQCREKVKLIIVGKGDDMEIIQENINKLGLQEQCQLTGYVENDELIDFLANCRALFYAPYDEDYGYATIEAFLAKKPVLTCHDSGEIATLVKQTGSGFVCSPQATEIAENIDKIYQLNEQQLEKLAENGYQFASQINWKNVLQKLVLDNTQ